MARGVALMVNRAKADANRAEAEVAALIERFGRLVLTENADRGERLKERQRSHGDIELVVTLGGDGTILSLTGVAGELGLPLLGVNLGKLGFLAEFDLDALRREAGSIFGSSALRERALDRLRAEVYADGADRARFEGSALNDVVVTAGPPYRMISIALSVDGGAGPEVSGDGMIVSTPTGSTAYTLSAGGPILAPEVGGLVITPIAAHTLSFRPIVVDARSVVEMRLERVNSEDGHGTQLLLDGRPDTRLDRGDRVVIRRDGQVRFVTNPARSYWETLVGKLRWAQAPHFRAPGGA